MPTTGFIHVEPLTDDEIDDILPSITDPDTSVAHLLELTRHFGEVADAALFEIADHRRPELNEQLQIARKSTEICAWRLARYTSHPEVMSAILAAHFDSYQVVRTALSNDVTLLEDICAVTGRRISSEVRRVVNAHIGQLNLTAEDFTRLATDFSSHCESGVYLFPWLPKEFVEASLLNPELSSWARVTLITNPHCLASPEVLTEIATTTNGRLSDVAMERLLSEQVRPSLTTGVLKSLVNAESYAVRGRLVNTLTDPEVLDCLRDLTRAHHGHVFTEIMRTEVLDPMTIRLIWKRRGRVRSQDRPSLAQTIIEHPCTDDLLRANIKGLIKGEPAPVIAERVAA